MSRGAFKRGPARRVAGAEVKVTGMRKAMRRRVLFLCRHNSCRSQMAEGFLSALAPDEFLAFSAGGEPAGLHPLAIKVMSEKGIDISCQRSKPLSRFAGDVFDYVITVCADDGGGCPVFPGKAVRRMSWAFRDPAAVEGDEETKLGAFREVRDRIEEAVRGFIMEAAAADSPPPSPDN